METELCFLWRMRLALDSYSKSHYGNNMYMTDIHNSVQNLWMSSYIQYDLSSQQEFLQLIALAE